MGNQAWRGAFHTDLAQRAVGSGGSLNSLARQATPSVSKENSCQKIISGYRDLEKWLGG